MRIVILAGGRSSRFGSDKANAIIGHGATMLERIVDAALCTGLETIVVGRSACPLGWTRDNVLFVPDEKNGFGPLGGLITALHATGDEVLLCACDMPLLNREAFEWLMAVTREADEFGVATSSDGRLEPLFSRYTTRCLQHAQHALEHGILSLHSLIENCAFKRVEAPDWLRPLLRNVNTLDELHP